MEIKSLSEISLADTELVLLDLDNTLYAYAGCHKKAISKVISLFSGKYNTSESEIHNLYLECRSEVHLFYKNTANSHSRFYYFQSMTEKLSDRTETEMVLKSYHLYWDTFIENMELFHDSLPFLETCRDKEIPVIIVTDMTSEIQFKKILQLNIEKYIKYLVTSEEAGVEKPDEKIYNLAVSKIKSDVDISKVIMIGDDVRKDKFHSEKLQVINYYLNRTNS